MALFLSHHYMPLSLSHVACSAHIANPVDMAISARWGSWPPVLEALQSSWW